MSSNEDEDKRFLSGFSKTLAEALLENDREQQQQQQNPSSLINNATLSSTGEEIASLERIFNSFTYHEPLPSCNDAGLDLLGKALLSSLPSFLVSDETNDTTGRISRSNNNEGGIMRRRGQAQAVPPSSKIQLPKTNSKEQQQQELSISNRINPVFINGLVQALSRTVASTTKPTTNDTEKDSKAKKDDKLDDESFESIISSNIITPAGYATLGFKLFALAPLRILRASSSSADEKKLASQFLSLYDPIEEKDKDSAIKKNNDDNFSLPAPFGSSQYDAMNDDDHGDNDSMKEIFADDSDDDSFVFTSDRFVSSALAAAEAPNTTAPSSLSILEKAIIPPQSTLSQADIRNRVRHLLSHLTYSTICAHIPKPKWKAHQMSDSLIQLSLALKENCVDVIGMEQTWMLPLYLLRDRALDAIHGHDALVDLIKLLSLSSSSALSPMAKTTLELFDNDDMVFSFTSVLCNSKDIMLSNNKCNNNIRSRKLVWDLVVSSDFMVKLSRFVEIVRASRKRRKKISKANGSVSSGHSAMMHQQTTAAAGEENDATTMNVEAAETFDMIDHEKMVCILNILEIMSGITKQKSVLSNDSAAYPVLSKTAGNSPKMANILLSTGLFRELVLLCNITIDGSSNGISSSSNVVPSSAPDFQSIVTINNWLRLQKSLLALCIAYPEPLAAFALRVPDFVSMVTMFQKETMMGENVLWSLALLSNPDLFARKKTNILDKAHSNRIYGFEVMCKVSACSIIRSRTSNNSKEEMKALQLSLSQFIEFVEFLQSCPSTITQAFLKENDTQSSNSSNCNGRNWNHIVKYHLSELQSALSLSSRPAVKNSCPTGESSVEKRYSGSPTIVDQVVKEKQEDDNEVIMTNTSSTAAATLMTHQQTKEIYSLVAMTRKCIKVLMMLLDTNCIEEKGAANSNSKFAEAPTASFQKYSSKRVNGNYSGGSSSNRGITSKMD